MKQALVVHGGCAAVSAEEEAVRQKACERAAEVGWEILQTGGNALDAVAASVSWLEDEPVLNAGTGSYLQADGVARMDASIMSSDSRAGAVAQVPGLKHPIRLARYLLDAQSQPRGDQPAPKADLQDILNYLEQLKAVGLVEK